MLIVREEVPFDGSYYTDLGWQARSVDLSPYAGNTVRLHSPRVDTRILFGARRHRVRRLQDQRGGVPVPG